VCDFLHGWLLRHTYRILYDFAPSATANGAGFADKMSSLAAAAFTLSSTLSSSSGKIGET
jgi:hypothetical protein